MVWPNCVVCYIRSLPPVLGVGGFRLQKVIILVLGVDGFRLQKVLGSGCLGVAILALRSNSSSVSLRIFVWAILL